MIRDVWSSLLWQRGISHWPRANGCLILVLNFRSIKKLLRRLTHWFRVTSSLPQHHSTGKHCWRTGFLELRGIPKLQFGGEPVGNQQLVTFYILDTSPVLQSLLTSFSEWQRRKLLCPNANIHQSSWFQKWSYRFVQPQNEQNEHKLSGVDPWIWLTCFSRIGHPDRKSVV